MTTTSPSMPALENTPAVQPRPAADDRHKPDRHEPGYQSPFAHILDEMEDDRRNLRRAFLIALAVHVVLLFIHLPSLVQPMEVTPAAKEKAYVIQQVRFRPPQAAPQREIPEKKRRKIPIPDPTPNDPEPIREMRVDLPEMDYDLPLGELNLEIPEGPPGPALGEVLEVGGEVQAPVKVYEPRPVYTEEARQARVQGVVILQVTVDTEGNVHRPQIIKGLPMGLSESALETVKQWKFKPATRNGKPVPVYYNLTINFSMQ